MEGKDAKREELVMQQHDTAISLGSSRSVSQESQPVHEREEFQQDENAQLKNQIVSLVLQRKGYVTRIHELEGQVATLKERLEAARVVSRSRTSARCDYKDKVVSINHKKHRSRTMSDLEKVFERNEVGSRNEELLLAVDQLRAAVALMEAEQRIQQVNHEAMTEQLTHKAHFLEVENANLKKRVADEILSKRFLNRLEAVNDKFFSARRVRTGGRLRLEALQRMMMRCHDDRYFLNRYDARLMPVRNVTLLFCTFHGVNELHCSEFKSFLFVSFLNVLQRFAKVHGGLRIAAFQQFTSFVFSNPDDALQFAYEVVTTMNELIYPEAIISQLNATASRPRTGLRTMPSP